MFSGRLLRRDTEFQAEGGSNSETQWAMTNVRWALLGGFRRHAERPALDNVFVRARLLALEARVR